MKKKVLSMFLVAAMTASMVVGCGGNGGSGDGTEGGSGTSSSKKDDKTITIWVAEATVDLTKQKVEEFLASDAKYEGWKINVEAVSESEAATNMITDVQGGADIYSFAQDQMTRLVAAGALSPASDENANWIKEQNNPATITAATVGDRIYAYPLTADNGYFLYYDKSVVTDPSSLEQIVADCEAAGKNFYMKYEDGWYQPMFFFGTGCTVTYDTDAEGNFTGCTMDYASDKGLVALKKIIEITSSPNVINGADASKAQNWAAIVDGIWDKSTAQEVLGDNYGVAKLPSFTGSDGNTYQLSGFNGCKFMGIKQQEDAEKLSVCTDIVKFLTGAEMQLERYNQQGWGPSNLEAAADEAVQSDETLAAFNEQFQYTVAQGQYPQAYWDAAASLGGDLTTNKDTKELNSASDDDLMAVLQTFQDNCKAAASAAE